MGSPLGPLMANALMCNIEEKLKNQNKMPAFYKRYVDDTLGMPDVSAVPGFLLTLNEIHQKNRNGYTVNAFTNLSSRHSDQ